MPRTRGTEAALATLSESHVERLLQPYVSTEIQLWRDAAPVETIAPIAVSRLQELIPALGAYLDLLLRWNEKTNLTAVRSPDEIVRRHFGESLFAGRVLEKLSAHAGTLLDFGSGAGFPGVPIQLLLPSWKITLAESQGKKVAFLRETVRVLGAGASVWAGRVEGMPVGTTFSSVTMRAVDSPVAALAAARARVAPGGYLLRLLSGGAELGGLNASLPGLDDGSVVVDQL